MNQFENISNKRGKSLNKTGMVMINENEDMVDGLSDNPMTFFKHKKDSYNPIEKEKSKTTNVVDLLKEIKYQNKTQAIYKDRAMFENTFDLKKLKKNSFFSQSKYIHNNP
jgi:hypothetical protein